jgi:hypothetical protein
MKNEKVRRVEAAWEMSKFKCQSPNGGIPGKLEKEALSAEL